MKYGCSVAYLRWAWTPSASTSSSPTTATTEPATAEPAAAEPAAAEPAATDPLLAGSAVARQVDDERGLKWPTRIRGSASVADSDAGSAQMADSDARLE